MRMRLVVAVLGVVAEEMDFEQDFWTLLRVETCSST
jgi:hypothetical protein